MPVCHYCSKNNLYSDRDVYQVQEDIGKYFRPAHRICHKCLEKYEKKNNTTLTILKEHHSKTNKLLISIRKGHKRKEYEMRRGLK